jgi:hypothetical protein
MDKLIEGLESLAGRLSNNGYGGYGLIAAAITRIQNQQEKIDSLELDLSEAKKALKVFFEQKEEQK